MTAVRGQALGFIVVVADVPVPGATGAAGRAATLVQAAAIDHVVHLFVMAERPPPPLVVAESATVGEAHGAQPAGRATNSGGLPTIPGVHSATRLRQGASDRRRPARDLVAEVAAHLGAVDARAIEGVLGIGLQLAATAGAVADWLGVPLVIDAADDHGGLLRNERPDVAVEPDWYLGAGCAARAATVLVASAHEAEQVATHVSADRIVVVPDAAPQVPWQVGPPTGSGQVLVRGDFTQAADLAGARWLMCEVLPLLPEAFSLQLSGTAGDEVRHLAHRRPGVRVLGPPDDLLALYHFADVAVAAQPVRGAGRQAVLEAFRHKRAVVATKAAVDGLQTAEGIHVRTAEDPDAFAAAVMGLSRAHGERAEQLVTDQVTAAFHLANAAHDPLAIRDLAADVLSTATGARPSTAA
jgi:hypothetical protein